MKTNYRKSRSVRIAVPYYGSISSPPFGLSRLFFIAELDPETRTVAEVILGVWDPKEESNLSTWLRQMGVKGIICSDAGSQYRIALNSDDIWIIWRQRGEAADLVERWANGELLEGSHFACGTPKNKWCSEQFEMAMGESLQVGWSSETRV